jgi:hypothetical protein
MRKLLTGFAAILFVSVVIFRADAQWKTTAHIASMPLIEGAGIYSSVVALGHSETAAPKVMGIANLGLLATNATLGAITMFGSDDLKPKLTRIHRIIGCTLSAAALGLSISMSVDDGVNTHTGRYVSYGYTVLTVVPIVMFSF